ncbi:MAG: hypothetical protein GY749_49295 [Desulfobacteraceae bacterium]|nr:hypothetical protein [Desulfobacteraceae bacterium]
MRYLLYWITAFFLVSMCCETFVQAGFTFPKTILYKESVNGNIMGNCEIKFRTGIEIDNQGLYWLKLSNFQGFGYRSTDEVHTYIYPDLSLFDTQLKQNGKIIQEMRLQKHNSGNRRLIFRDMQKSEFSELELSSDHKVIDFISSFILTSQKAAKRNKNDEKLVFFFRRNTKIVNLIYQGLATANFMGQTVATEVWAIKYHNIELFRFNIFNDNGFAFPIIADFHNKFVP